MITETKNTKSFYNSEIPDDWEVLDFGEAFSFVKSFAFSRENLTSEKTQDAIRNIHYGDIHTTYKNEILDLDIEKTIPYLLDGLIDSSNFKNEDFASLKDGDLIIADASEDYKGVCDCVELKNVNGNKVLAGLHTFAARASEDKIALGFRTYVLNHEKVVSELKRIATGTSVYSVSKSNISKVKIALPPLGEQKVIASLLSKWDEAISKNQALIQQKEERKKWLMQNLLNGKKRLNQNLQDSKINRINATETDFENSVNSANPDSDNEKGKFSLAWKVQSLNELIKPIVREIDKPKEQYIGIGLRSHGKGTFLKHAEQPEKNSMDKFYIVRHNDLIVNITFAWEQAIAIVKKDDDGALASHRFPTYTFINEKSHPDFFRFFILQPRMKYMLQLISPGGAGRNRVMSKSDFLKLEFKLPDYKEQTAIAKVLQAADKEIQLLKSKTDKLKEQKKGLMQVLLTGKVRLKLN